MAPRPRGHSTEDVGGREGPAEKEISPGGLSVGCGGGSDNALGEADAF